MMRLILSLTLIFSAQGMSVLDHCPLSVDGDQELADVKISEKVFVFIEGTLGQLKSPKVIRAVSSKDRIPFKISLDCATKTVKVTARVGKTWEKRAEANNIVCKDDMEIVINNKLRELWIGDAREAIKMKAVKKGSKADKENTGSFNIDVSKNVKALRISNGVCSAYPPSIKTCTTAREYFLKHESCADYTTKKVGFMPCGNAPKCEEDGSFALMQSFAGSLFGCVRASDGELLEERFRSNEVVNFATYCADKYDK